MIRRIMMTVTAVVAMTMVGCTQLDEDVIKNSIVEIVNEQLLCNTAAEAIEVTALDLGSEGDHWEGTAMLSCKSATGSLVSVPMNVTVKQMKNNSEDVWVECSFFNAEAASGQLGVE